MVEHRHGNNPSVHPQMICLRRHNIYITYIKFILYIMEYYQKRMKFQHLQQHGLRE